MFSCLNELLAFILDKILQNFNINHLLLIGHNMNLNEFKQIYLQLGSKFYIHFAISAKCQLLYKNLRNYTKCMLFFYIQPEFRKCWDVYLNKMKTKII